MPTLLGPAPCIDDWGHVPAISQLGLNKEKAFHLFISKLYSAFYKCVEACMKVKSPDNLRNKKSFCLIIQVSKGLMFTGGESAALTRVHEYFWNKAR